MSPHARELSYAVRPRMLARYGGRLAVVVGTLLGVPAVFAALAGDGAIALRLGAGCVALLAGGAALGRVASPGDLQRNEALTLAALAFLLAPVPVAVALAGECPTALDALFEAVSGVTTTGLSTLGSVEGRSPSFLFLRAWSQWFGGLGIVALSVAVLAPPGRLAKELADSAVEDHDAVGSTRVFARRALGIYAALTVVGALGTWALGSGPLDALLYALAAVSTGGFAPSDASLGGLDGTPAAAWVSALSLLGALSFGSLLRLRRGGLRAAARDPQLLGLPVVCVAASALLVGLFLARGASWPAALRDGALTAVSAQTTTGFSSLDVAALEPAAKLLLVVSMTIGGSLGSTAGGVKLLRLLVLARVVQAAVRRVALPPHAVLTPRLGGRAIEEREVHAALTTVALFALTILGAWSAFLVAGRPPLDSLFEVVSATCTVGLSTGETAPDLAPGLKLVLCAAMWLGRLEVMAFLILLSPRTWLAKRAGIPKRARS